MEYDKRSRNFLDKAYKLATMDRYAKVKPKASVKYLKKVQK